jgi:hypothetical protein
MLPADPQAQAEPNNRCAQMHDHLADARKLLCLATAKASAFITTC